LHKRVENYLRQVNLFDEVKDRLKEPANSLSIGQQQRLCLARGLAVDPEIILADEPLRHSIRFQARLSNKNLWN